MKKPLRQAGNGWELYLPKPIIKLMGISPSDKYALFNVKDKVLSITKINNDEIDKFENFLTRNIRKSGGGRAIFMPLTIIELLEIDPETDLVEYEINDMTLSVKKG